MNLLKIILTLALSTVIYSCKNEPQRVSIPIHSEKVIKHSVNSVIANAHSKFKISGMSCQVGCAKKIEESLSEESGIKMVKVDFESSTMVIDFDSTSITNDQIKNLVLHIGDYEATLTK